MPYESPLKGRQPASKEQDIIDAEPEVDNLESDVARACQRLEEGGQGVAAQMIRAGFERAKQDPQARKMVVDLLRRRQHPPRGRGDDIDDID